jgi:hypothetical protein
MAIGSTEWAVPEGYLPDWSNGPEPEMTSHGSLAFLNAGDQDAQVEVTCYFNDRDPAGPFRFEVPARRTLHVRLNEFEDPERLPRAKEFASTISSDVPIVVQYTRLDSRQAENALLSTIAHPA